jgi:hypothetical protein
MYTTKNYEEQGGERWVVGGELDLVAGGALKSGGTTILRGGQRTEQVAKVALAAVDTAGGVFAWANPEGVPIIITRVVLDVTTQSTGACTVDVGVAANGTTLNDGLIDGVSVAAAGLVDNLDNAGTNGRARQKVTAGQFVTGSVASGASAGLVGSAYVFYVVA